MPVTLPHTFADGPGNIASGVQVMNNLNALNNGVAMSVGTSLPTTSLVDGQDYYYLADAAAGVVWHFKYRAASAAAYKWECVGGHPLYAEVAGTVSTSSATYVDIDGTTPSITLPLAGDYMIEIGARMSNNAADQGSHLAAKLGAAAASDSDSVNFYSSTVNAENYGSRRMRRTGLAAAAAVKLQYRMAGTGASTFARRALAVMPVRVG